MPTTEQTESAAPTAGPPRGTAGYGAAAAQLAEQYESVTFEQVHREILALLPPAPARVADLGAGTGRDAAALAALGHQVTAVEPTAELRALGRRLHAAAPVEWIDDSLPALATLRGEFDLILATAVWMHLDERERAEAMRRIGALLAPGGRAVLTLRHGPVPPGRRMFDVSAAETVRLAATHHLHPLQITERADLHGRPEVRWSTVALERGADGLPPSA